MIKKFGAVALVGSGEFLQPIEELDRLLLERLGEPGRVAILPTASAPDGNRVPKRWAEMGVRHFKKLGAEAQAVMVLNRSEADSTQMAAQISECNFVYLSGGKPQYLLQTLKDTACWQAIKGVYENGGVVVGCSAGAMALAGYLPGFPPFFRSEKALGLVPGLVVIPHFDEIPGWLSGISRFSSRNGTIVGVEGSTGLICSGEEWLVLGRKGVTLFSNKGKRRFESGDRLPLSSRNATIVT
ncbi:Type 1 glutamine amidotransferase-like domain-containing protein [Candidatus Chlorohelix allophototropha]|uniref:Type 1 glutamine amidotransferase-like domain-containing protein n=1 Tax=Candidatus Chlorohelix allophototropha TaxID=3003348 RepID=A0ABY9B334_9CHLR|nr:Type 1 glutamine amidotransferase-like domain-containing protein [Chloroflexota bacterium L227-S17]